MEFVSMIVYFIIILIIIFVVAFGAYIVYDYINHKKELEANLAQSNKDINSNFATSLKDLKYLYDETKDNEKDIEKNTKTITELSAYTSNTSNTFATDFNLHARSNENTLNTFDKNLSKYFMFNDGNKKIADNILPNNKIFNYVFGTSIPNMQLISRTTAINGLTINSDINKELKICSAISPTTCIKTNIDKEGKFTISSAGSSNIIFKNNDNTSTLANFDTFNKAIYFGGNNPTTSALYIKDNDVYIKNLKLITPRADKNKLFTYDSYNKMPIYTTVNVLYKKLANNTTSLKIVLQVYFNMTYTISNNAKLYVNILPPVSMTDIDGLMTPTNNIIKFEKLNSPATSLASSVSYDSNGTFKFSNLTEIPMGHILTFDTTVSLADVEKDATISYATSSYLL